jgi:hypothetical protein
MSTHAHHDNHHRLIDERRAAHETRSSGEKLRKREAVKRYIGTLKGHLACCHDVHFGPFVELHELEARHREMHVEHATQQLDTD